ncbi:Dihydropteroate synthase [Ruminococcaceae bacterium KH2T8]|nr:Dihydropteroate synthase [Ruminococcaceae bacterium KH2T8]
MNLARRFKGTFSCRDRKIVFEDKTLCMGILNVTPDSFSDGGKHFKQSDALFAAEKMINEGAAVIDVGGESTRPGYTEISVDEELSRIVPVIEAINANFETVISVDTYKSGVAKGALEAGCHIINDIYGFMYDPNMASVVKEYDAGAILMFNCRRNGECIKEDIVERAIREIAGSVKRAIDAGLPEQNIMVDPGVGFGTSRQQDIDLIRAMDKMSEYGKYPVLLACSRKRTPAAMLGRDTAPDQRDPVSIGMALAGTAFGANMVRVHNVGDTADAIIGYEGVLRGSSWIM